MKKYAIIVAAGSGARMKSDVPKQFMLLKGKPLFSYAVNQFLESDTELKVLLVLPFQECNDIDNLLNFVKDRSRVECVRGGTCRFDSVKNGLAKVPNESVVFIHDAVRPFVSKVLIDLLYETVLEKSNAIPCVDLTESIRYVEDEKNYSVDRRNYKLIQTPQAFRSEFIKQAYWQASHNLYTDDASVYEDCGNLICLVEGLKENIKITYPQDLEWASWMLNKELNPLTERRKFDE